MRKKPILLFFLLTLIIAGIFVILNKYTKPVEAGSEHNVYGWAWSENIGWISFNNTSGGGPTNYGVNINLSTGILSGYAWSENIGWISFCSETNTLNCPNPTSDLSGCPSGSCEARLNTSNNEISGWARAYRAINPEGQTLGGWDGWIRLRNTLYGVWIDTAPDPDEFMNWAWGGDDTEEEAVIGWISFNRKNCDPNGDGDPNDGPPGCVETGRDYSSVPIPDYKVMIDLEKITISDLKAMGMFCADSPNGLVTLSWKYNGASPQSSKYQLQIANVSDQNFSSPVVDITAISPADTVGVSVKRSTVPEINELPYSNISYHWRVQVWDDNGNGSGWSASNCSMVELDDGFNNFETTCFRTPKHPYPELINFEWWPLKPSENQAVKFCSIDEGSEAEGKPICKKDTVFCYDSDNYCDTWYWTFENGNPPTSIEKNPKTIKFKKFKPGGNQVELTVTDADTYYCSKDDYIGGALPLPEWKEIAPF